MRSLVPPSIAAAVLLAFTNAAVAAPQCPPGTKLYCPKPAPNAKAPPPCRCVPLPPGSGTGGGKAEIKKKNVPQVQPNKQPKD